MIHSVRQTRVLTGSLAAHREHLNPLKYAPTHLCGLQLSIQMMSGDTGAAEAAQAATWLHCSLVAARREIK